MGMGRIIVHLHGRPSDKSLSNLLKDYHLRLKSKVKLEIHSSKLSSHDYLSLLPENTILLDEGGEMTSSVEFSKKFDNWNLSGEDTHLAIGPADGFEKGHNRISISLSKMTFPHELAAVLLMEQLYRSYEISRGSAYHRV